MKKVKHNKKFFLTTGIILIIIQILAYFGSFINENSEGGLISPVLVILTFIDFIYYFRLKSK